jgi:hypothetical protein
LSVVKTSFFLIIFPIAPLAWASEDRPFCPH